MVNWNLIAGLDGKFTSQDIRRNILTYIMQNYPATQIDFIEKDQHSYRIDIRGGDSLIFDFKGQFVKAVN